MTEELNNEIELPEPPFQGVVQLGRAPASDAGDAGSNPVTLTNIGDRRVFSVDVGNMSKAEAKAIIQRYRASA